MPRDGRDTNSLDRVHRADQRSNLAMRERKILTTVARPLVVLLQSILDFAFPPYCILCNSLLKQDERLVCNACWNNLPQLDDRSNLVQELKNKFSGEIFFSDAIAIWQYSPKVQEVIHRFKYGNFKILANRIGGFMAAKLNPLNFSPDQTLLVPVPLHKTRARERGYNQSALLCRTIASQTGLPYNEHVLKRVRYTRSQTKLSASERLKNVNQAFRVVNKEPIQNKNVILIDDIITTGATMNECARELITNGARKVLLCAIARA